MELLGESRELRYCNVELDLGINVACLDESAITPFSLGRENRLSKPDRLADVAFAMQQELLNEECLVFSEYSAQISLLWSQVPRDIYGEVWRVGNRKWVGQP